MTCNFLPPTTFSAASVTKNLEEQESKKIAAFYSKKNLSSILGDEGFKDWLKKYFQELRFKQDASTLIKTEPPLLTKPEPPVPYHFS